MNLGGVPCIKILALKIRPLIQMQKAVNRITPINPTTGCHIGIVTGVAMRTTISIGVNGGINDKPVEKLLNGSFNIGNITNMGIKTGIIAGNCND